MDKHLLLILLGFGLIGCATTPPPDPSKDFRATALAPFLEQSIHDGVCWVGCKKDLLFSCDSMSSIQEATSCAVSKCIAHYQDVKQSSYWKDKNEDAACIAFDTSSYSLINDNNLLAGSFANLSQEDRAEVEKELKEASEKNLNLYIGPRRQAELDWKEKHIQRFEEKKKIKQLAAQKRFNQLQEAKKLKAEAEKKKLQEQKEQFMAYIETLKKNCKTYGFSSDDAIATCVQREINLERDRVQAQQIAKQNQPIIQQVQPNSGPNYDALSSMGSCLQTEGNFAACSNAWQGYTPPKKTVTECRYDAFGNAIIGTCTTQ